ncbi:MAG: DUF5110 domain-containing protein [Lachnospiraceae bacterium]|nr:DUF5110 domain-containing protein [Lachnospiraceae bacterium]
MIRCQEQERKVLVSIGRREGAYENKPEKRVWKAFVHGYDGPVQTECEEGGSGTGLYSLEPSRSD